MGKIEMSPCCFAANRTLLWASRQMGRPVDNLASVISNQSAASVTEGLLGVRFCITPRTMTGFYNPAAQYAACRGDTEKERVLR